MTVVEMTEGHAETAREWFAQRLGGREFPWLAMPVKGLSAVDDDGKLLAVATIFVDFCRPMAFCGWAMANPSNSPRISRSALDDIFTELPKYAKDTLKCKWLFTCFGSHGINTLLTEIGYAEGDKNSEQRFVNLGE